jgi:hypothetical protein
MATRIENMKLGPLQKVKSDDQESKGFMSWIFRTKKEEKKKMHFENFTDVLEWEADKLKNLEDAEDGLRIEEDMVLTGWHIRYDKVARAEYKKVDGKFSKRGAFTKDSMTEVGIALSSKMQVHKKGLGHLQFHLTVDRNPKYYVNIARAIAMLTFFGVYTGAMGINEVEGRGTVSFVLGLTVITFKYSVMLGDQAPMPPTLLEETEVDNFMDYGFILLCVIITENMLCGFLITLSDGDSGNPELFDLNMDTLRTFDLIFYSIVTLVWLLKSLDFFWWRLRSQKKKQAVRSAAELKEPIEIEDKDNKRVAKYYEVEELDLTSGNGDDDAKLRDVLQPTSVFGGTFKRKALAHVNKDASFRSDVAGPKCQDFPATLSEETVLAAQDAWLLAEGALKSKGDTIGVPGWSDEATLEYLLFAVRGAHLPGTFYKEIALRLFARMYDGGPFDIGHTPQEVLGMIQYETDLKSSRMKETLMKFADKHKLNPKFEKIMLHGNESWTSSKKSKIKASVNSPRSKTKVTPMKDADGKKLWPPFPRGLQTPLKAHDMDQKKHQGD